MSRGTTLVGSVVGALAVYGVLIAWVVSMHLPGVDVLAAVAVAVLALLTSLPLQVIAHEAGHAVAAISVGLRIKGVRLFGLRVAGNPGRSQHRSHVSLDLARSKLWLPGRVSWTLVAGPAANLVTAALAVLVARAADEPWYVRVAAAGVAVGGGVLGVVNLVPWRRDGRMTDGSKLRLWMLARRRIPPGVTGSGRWLESIAASTGPRRVQAEPAGEGARTVMTPPAVLRLIAATAAVEGNETAVRQHYAALVQALRRPDVEPSLVRAFTGATALVLIVPLMQGQLRSGRPADPGWVERVVVLTELGLGHAPDELITRSALGMARLLQRRDAEARRVLLDIDIDQAPKDDVALAYAVRAIAETGCGDRDQARRLLRAAERLAPGHAVVRLGRFMVDHVERAQAVGDSSG